MEIIQYLVLFYIIVLNIVGFASMGIDKSKAKRNLWRTPERILIGIAFAGGSIGSFLGMRYFHHKTKHLKFTILVPLAIVFNILLYVYFIRNI